MKNVSYDKVKKLIRKSPYRKYFNLVSKEINTRFSGVGFSIKKK